MESQKLQHLLSSVCDKTMRGELQWHDTADEDAFQVLFDAGSLIIAYRRIHFEDDCERPTHSVSVTVLNKTGSIVERASVSSERDGEYDQMYELFEMARRSARKSDDVLDGLIRELSKP